MHTNLQLSNLHKASGRVESQDVFLSAYGTRRLCESSKTFWQKHDLKPSKLEGYSDCPILLFPCTGPVWFPGKAEGTISTSCTLCHSGLMAQQGRWGQGCWDEECAVSQLLLLTPTPALSPWHSEINSSGETEILFLVRSFCNPLNDLFYQAFKCLSQNTNCHFATSYFEVPNRNQCSTTETEGVPCQILMQRRNTS